MKPYQQNLSSISSYSFCNEYEEIKELLILAKFDSSQLKNIDSCAKYFIQQIKNTRKFSVEQFLQKYSLSSVEGIAIICLAESLVRIPDNKVALELVIDKISGKNWQKYIGKSKSKLINIASIGLFASSKFVDINNNEHIFSKLLFKLGKSGFLAVLRQAIKLLSKEFIIGYDLISALHNTKHYSGYKFSLDLLGESARTLEQANKYYQGYLQAIDLIGAIFPNQGEDIFTRPNLSVKLSALYPRIEYLKLEDIKYYLVPKLVVLIDKLKTFNISISFDAEDAKKLDIYLQIFTEIMLNPKFKDFNGIGIVVQAYQKRAYKIIDYVIQLAKDLGKKVPIRLVKGAYWDTEIKYSQEQGMSDYPVFTKKEFSDISYLACAHKILEHDHLFYPQFATHNALTAASIIEMSGGKVFEFQKLHGMGDVLHSELVKNYQVRIYAPIGEIKDLLAYLMRRLLENGSSASFVNQVNNDQVILEELVFNLNNKVERILLEEQVNLIKPQNIYLNRENSMGYDLNYEVNINEINNNIAEFSNKIYQVGSIFDGNDIIIPKLIKKSFRPANFTEQIGTVSFATKNEIKKMIDSATSAFTIWSTQSVAERANILRNIAKIYDINKFELYSLLIREGGKTIQDAINEVREAIDFCQYYAACAEQIIQEKILPGPTGEHNTLTMHARGVFLCISPWNFPLAIFTGQIVAALVTGNTVIAKPAEQTSIIASVATHLMHKAGIPPTVLHLLLASGNETSKYVVSDERISGVAFTGSTLTAKTINLTLAQRPGAIIPIIAETGGQNAMIVDSSALLEQVTDDVITSAFYSTGQRCSALRVLYIQQEVYTPLLSMITGAMEVLKIGDTINFSIDLGPVIDKSAYTNLIEHIKDMKDRRFKVITNYIQNDHLANGYFFYPYIIEINKINDIENEKFGPILHVISYDSNKLDEVINEINNYGFGLTFGIHSRIEQKIQYVRSRIRAGNIYANRSIIGAQVETHPFGGENKSGTGFKAGGPYYLLRFLTERTTSINVTAVGGNIELLNQI